MKKFILRGIVVFSLIIILISSCYSVCAAEEKRFSIQLSHIAAAPGDTVAFNVTTSDNPGIMAMTFTFCYDPEVLVFEEYIGGIFSKDTVVDHGSYVSIVYCASRNITRSGTMFGMKFTVKEDAPAGESTVTLKNIRPDERGENMDGCFANWGGDKLIASVSAGWVDVALTQQNCRHQYGNWTVTVPAGCKTEGVQTRTCKICNHSEMASIPAVGHDFAEEWVIDRPATENEKGKMSRHCTRCDAVTDEISFKKQDAEENHFSGEIDTVVSADQWKPLKEREEARKQKESENTEVPEEKTDQKIVLSEITEKETEIRDANRLVEAVKDPPIKTPIYKAIRYLFGNGEQDGFFKVIFHSIPTYVYYSVLAAVLIIGALIVI